jgi:hypothetical protein
MAASDNSTFASKISRRSVMGLAAIPAALAGGAALPARKAPDGLPSAGSALAASPDAELFRIEAEVKAAYVAFDAATHKVGEGERIVEHVFVGDALRELWRVAEHRTEGVAGVANCERVAAQIDDGLDQFGLAAGTMKLPRVVVGG